MKTYPFILTTFLFLITFGISHSTNLNETYEYEGTVGNVSVKMTLSNDSNDDIHGYKGSYYYTKVGTPIKIRGVWVARLGTIELVEFGTTKQTVSGYFSLTYANGTQLLKGTWTSFDKKRVLPVTLKLAE